MLSLIVVSLNELVSRFVLRVRSRYLSGGLKDLLDSPDLKLLTDVVGAMVPGFGPKRLMGGRFGTAARIEPVSRVPARSTTLTATVPVLTARARRVVVDFRQVPLPLGWSRAALGVPF